MTYIDLIDYYFHRIFIIIFILAYCLRMFYDYTKLYMLANTS